MTIITDPKDIQTESFRIVEKYLADSKLPRAQKEIVKRIIHATSDFNYAEDVLFHPTAIKYGLEAIQGARDIIVDASMVKAGINKKILSGFGGKVICFIDNEDIARLSSRSNITRSILAMRRASKLMDRAIVAIGNAPTALFEVCDLVSKGSTKPALIIGLPVGFVGAKEAKKKLRTLKVPYITNKSRYGGSSVAAACVNALLKIANDEESRDA